MAQLFVFLIFGGFGLAMLGVGVVQFFRQRRLLSRGQRVRATVVKSEVFSSRSADTDQRLRHNNSTTTHRPEVRFRYEVEGQMFESELMYPNIIVVTYASRDAAAEVLKPFPVGAEVWAFVDVTLPDQAYLINQAGSGPLVFMIIGLVLPPVAWWVGRWV